MYPSVMCVVCMFQVASVYVSVSFEMTVASVTAHYVNDMLLCEPLAGTSLHGRSIMIKCIKRRP